MVNDLEALLQMVEKYAVLVDKDGLILRARIYVKNLENDLREARERLVNLGMTMPCGHLSRFATTSEDGTHYCVMCAWHADQKTLKKVLRGEE